MINDIDKSSIDMIDWSCCNCGCVQWMPKTFNEQLRGTHATFYCVNGHGNYYSKKTELEEVQGRLMNEYSKNAQLESVIVALKNEITELKGRNFIERIINK
jgi:hypothetical protein